MRVVSGGNQLNLAIGGQRYLVSPHEYPNFKGTLVDTLQTDYPELQLYLYVRE
ncbi:MAG: hypothetical protein R2792_06690 [Saprospiraceae bacterium]